MGGMMMALTEIFHSCSMSVACFRFIHIFLSTHVPSSSSTATPASHPRNTASSYPLDSNKAYRNEEHS